MKEELNFEDLLPSEPTKKEKAEMKKRYLTDDAIVYRVKNYRDPLTDVSVRACECVCSACGETFYLERTDDAAAYTTEKTSEGISNSLNDLRN